MFNYTFMIRKAVESDAPAIYEIMQDSFKKYMKDTDVKEPLDALTETLDDIIDDIRTKEVFIALIDGIAVGSARVAILPDNTAYLSRFGVRPAYNNIGVGMALMSLIDKMLIEKGIKCVKLHTASKNRDLIRFYYGRGFYIESTTNDRGYIRALMVKEYQGQA
ncbi:MAG: GNAT family N-acetyltransferase [Clostridiaceae bacterium]|jgi:ribosomal protein S18 acetylase RimI-like enzyme|nr:GNAT family N-acetyltransferase [Bacillota bacterium]NLP08537.1 GNAT family N-acetyltransferase [Clostridiaceae bacterium]